MEIFQTIWTALSTPNPTLIQISGMLLVFIEITVSVLLFTTVLNIPENKSQKFRYILLVSVISIISNNFIPKPYGPILHMILTPILIMFIFKVSLLKSLIAEILPTIIIVLLESLFIKIFSSFLHIEYSILQSTPIYRLPLVLLIYLSIYLLYRFLKFLHLNINFVENLDTRSKYLLIFTSIFGIIAMAVEFYLVNFYVDTVPFYITLFSILILISYFFLNLYSLTRTTKLATVSQDLEQTKLYNNTLQILHDNMRAFKHDFANIVQAIGRICK